MSSKRLVVRAALVGTGFSLIPAGLLLGNVAAEHERVGVVLGLLGLVTGALLVPTTVLVTGVSVLHPRPWRAAPWLPCLLGPLMMEALCLLAQGPERRARFMWIPDAIDTALDLLFVAGTLAFFVGAAWYRTREWHRPALLWLIFGGISWFALFTSIPHSDVLTDGLLQTLLLLPLAALALAPPFVLWTFPRALAAEPSSAPADHATSPGGLQS